MAKIKSLFYKLILLVIVVLLTVLTAMGGRSIHALALDQEVRCGLPEHTHSESCYMNGVLLCREKAHLHSSNCYLVLLEDNNVNWLLQAVDDTEDKSLEGVIDSAMVQALTLNDSFTGTSPPLELTGTDINSLNQTIEDNDIEPAVVLNENLMSDSKLNYTPTAYGSGASTYAIGDTPETGRRAVNFYILLDGKVTLIDSATLTNSTPDYYSYSNTVSIYTKQVVTGLTTSGLGSKYFLYYNTTGNVTSASSFSTRATHSNSRVGMANTTSARYAMLFTNTSGTYQPVEFYTVTLNYDQVNPSMDAQVRYVEEGQSPGLALSSQYAWYDQTGKQVTQIPAVTNTATYYAGPLSVTATFEDENGNTLAAPYTGTPANGLLQVPMPSLAGTAKENWYWIEKGSDGLIWYDSDETDTAEISANTVFVAIPNSYTVTFVDDTGQTRTQTVGYRETIVFEDLPAGWSWVAEDDTRYSPGDTSPPVTRDTSYTVLQRTLYVKYDVNFPSGAVSVVDSVPTIYGTGQSTVTDAAASNRPMVVRDLTSRTARRQISSSNKESVTYFFKGWKVLGTDLLIQPDTALSYNDLLNYASSADEVTLQGVWDEGGRYNSASFFVRFDSAAVDTNGNITSQPVENYTPEVFNTHVGGVDTSWSDQKIREEYEIADTTSDNSYTADQSIRALYGEKTDGVWLYDFPSDDHVFAYLKDYLAKNPGKQLTYEGEVVDPAQLNHDYYAIRWYVFKLEGSSWHADGKVYRKEGSITIDKTFGGDDYALQQEKDGFYILAENGTLDANGDFVAYPHNNSKFKEYLLVVNQNGANNLHRLYPDAEILIFDSETDNAHHYKWVIDSVETGEYWHIEEFPVLIDNYSCYAEYSVYDTDGAYSAIAEYGTRASVIGKTFALDEDPDQGLMVDFRNYYYRKETILIKKEDGKTGRPIGGAVFELWQNGNRLSFNFNEETGQYERDEGGDGAFKQIVTSSDGFSIISTTGFSYSYGDVIVKEVLPPAGYDPAPDITIGVDDTGQVMLKDIAGKPPDEWDTIAEVPDADVLVVKDHAAEFISVTVEKIWNTANPADSVAVVLQANGQHAAALFPGMTDAQVTLSAGNLWRHTWYNLPRYANGQIVQWGVKEVLIGGKPTLADGVTFANWTVTYSPGVGTDQDGDGDIDHWKFTVTNATRRLQLILTKIGTDGAILPGSTFSLEQVSLVNGQWQPVPGVSADTQTTDANGMLTFDNLTADVYYRLAELMASDGYFITLKPVILTMDGSGNIQRVLDDGTLAQLYDPLIQVTRPYNIQVVNIKMTQLPETGGMGTQVYMQSGLLLMMVSAAALLLYKRKCRREGMDTS